VGRRRRRQRLPEEPVTATIESLSHEGRGIARIEGKTVFVDNALPGETVRMRYRSVGKRFDAGIAEAVIADPAPERVEPACAFYGLCGGCSLQHMAPEAQIRFKQQTLAEAFEHIGKVAPRHWLEPLTGPVWGYRQKARLGVRNVPKKGRVLVGFREKFSQYLADMRSCEVLDPRVGHRLEALSELIGSLEAKSRIAQIEVAIGDEQAALVFRNLDPLNEADQARLAAFGEQSGFQIWLQPGGPDTAQPLDPDVPPLEYALPEFNVRLRFRPTDFTQVNAEINRRMVGRALDLLAPEPGERVLELFCGLGNFSLPLARSGADIVAVEGEAGLVQRARENAERNGIDNVTFHVANLFEPDPDAPWLRGQHYDRILFDPPRSGAVEILPFVAATGARRLVYVSCNPATLARDAGILVHEHGYTLEQAGVMDMFPHTAHVESIALFTREG